MMKNIAIEIKWGVLFIVMGLLWMVLERLVGLHDIHIDKHAVYTNIIAIPAIALYVFALRDKRKNFYQGTMSYKQGFVSGLIITGVVTLLSPLSQFITSTIITPDYFTNAIQYSVSAGLLTQESAEKYFNMTSYIVQATIGAPIMGIITTAVVAFITRTKTVAS